MIFTRMSRSETRLTSNTFSIHFSATNTPTPAVPLLFPDQNSLYLESLPVIIRQWPPRYLVSWTQQRSTFLRDSVSTTSQTLPFRVFTLRVPTLKFLRCLLDLPQWPDPALLTFFFKKTVKMYFCAPTYSGCQLHKTLASCIYSLVNQRKATLLNDVISCYDSISQDIL